MPEAAAANLLSGLTRAVEDGDALRAQRRLRELNALIGRLPLEALPPIQRRLKGVLADAERLRERLKGSLHDQKHQRRGVDAYRRMASATCGSGGPTANGRPLG